MLAGQATQGLAPTLLDPGFSVAIQNTFFDVHLTLKLIWASPSFCKVVIVIWYLHNSQMTDVGKESVIEPTKAAPPHLFKKAFVAVQKCSCPE